jgi:hypothetical protein
MNKNSLFLFFTLIVSGVLLFVTAFSLSFLTTNPSSLTASLTPPSSPPCPFDEDFTPANIFATSSVNFKQEALLLKVFLVRVENCPDSYSLNTCLGLFQEYCVEQGKCTTHYSFSQPAVITPEIRTLLCSEWTKRYILLYQSSNWSYLQNLFTSKDMVIPSWLTTSKQSFISYQQQVQQQQVANQANESVKQVINPEERTKKEEPVYVSSFGLGEQISLTKPEIKKNSFVLDPDNNVKGNSNNVGNDISLNRAQVFTMTNPEVSIFKNDDGSYRGEWFVGDAPFGLITIKILDKNGKEIYSGQTFYGQKGGVWFGDFQLDKNAIDPNQEYTFVISGGQKSGTYKFAGEALVKGGAIIQNDIVTQYTPKNSYINYINGAVSKNGKTLSLDLEIGKAAGPTQADNLTKLVIKTKTGEIIQTITGDDFLKALGGMQLNINLDLSNSKDFIAELVDSNNNTIERYNVNINDSGFVNVVKTIAGASGWGSVYDPIITTSGSTGPSGYSISINIRAAGTAVAQVIDATSGTLLGSYKGNEFTIAGSKDKFKPGYSYYIVYYDQNGNVAKTQIFRIEQSKTGGYFADIQDINKPPTFWKTCQGQYAIKVDGQIETIIINGKSYTVEEAKQLGIFNPDVLKIGQLVLNQKISSSLQNITVTYIDNLGVKQTATFTNEGGNIVMKEFSNTLVTFTKPSDEKIEEKKLNNGTTLSYYKTYQNNLFGDYYVKADNYKDLEIESIWFGYAPYDNDPSYKQKIIEQFKATGILPAGAQITFLDKNGGSVTINTSRNGESIGVYGPIYVRNDTTTKTEEEKVMVNKDKGTITIPITKVNDENTKKELENNDLYNDLTVQLLINEAKNDSYCMKHTCSFSKGAYTVTINPYDGKINIEVDETVKEAADKAAKEAADKEAAEKEKQRIKNRENYEKALDNMQGMTEELKNKLMDEYDAKNPPENPPPVGDGGGGGGKIYYTQ